jgi:hypothetical protein
MIKPNAECDHYRTYNQKKNDKENAIVSGHDQETISLVDSKRALQRLTGSCHPVMAVIEILRMIRRKGHLVNNFVVPGVSECEFIVLGMRVVRKIVAVKMKPFKNFFLLSKIEPPSIRALCGTFFVKTLTHYGLAVAVRHEIGNLLLHGINTTSAAALSKTMLPHVL